VPRQEGHPATLDRADEHRLARLAERRLDPDLLRVGQELIEAGPADNPDVRDRVHCGQATFSPEEPPEEPPEEDDAELAAEDDADESPPDFSPPDFSPPDFDDEESAEDDVESDEAEDDEPLALDADALDGSLPRLSVR
jgi:hypothetical protein